MPTSVRVDAETEALLERAAHLRAESKSQLIRMAVRQFCAQLLTSKTMTPYESIKDLLGCAEGPRDLARHAKRYLREGLLRDHNRRRTRRYRTARRPV